MDFGLPDLLTDRASKRVADDTPLSPSYLTRKRQNMQASPASRARRDAEMRAATIPGHGGLATVAQARAAALPSHPHFIPPAPAVVSAAPVSVSAVSAVPAVPAAAAVHWKTEDDEHLLELASRYGEAKWERVTERMAERGYSAVDCRQRWEVVMQHRTVKVRDCGLRPVARRRR